MICLRTWPYVYIPLCDDMSIEIIYDNHQPAITEDEINTQKKLLAAFFLFSRSAKH